jgi:hypothetical protein
MDGVRLTDAQKHRLNLKMRTVAVKKCFWEFPQVLLQVQKILVCEDTGIHVFCEVFGLLWSHLGPWMS